MRTQIPKPVSCRQRQDGRWNSAARQTSPAFPGPQPRRIVARRIVARSLRERQRVADEHACDARWAKDI